MDEEISPAPTGSIATALEHARILLRRDPALAEVQAREILNVAPMQAQAQLVLGVALRLQDRTAEAVRLLDALAKANPRSAETYFELGLALGGAGESGKSVAALRRATELAPDHAHAWRALGDELALAGEEGGADAAYARHIQASTRNPQLLEAGAALYANRLAIAERLLRAYLKEHPTDVPAIRMLAETGVRLGRLEDAEALLVRCLELAPGFVEARHNYAVVLHRLGKAQQALAETETLKKRDRRNAGYRALEAAVLGRIGEYGRAIVCYESLLKEFPSQPKVWMSYGHALKTVGRTENSIAAYRKSVALMPSLGEAYWSLANLKTFRFSPAEIEAMRAQLARGGLNEEDRVHLHFALGKALEDGNDYVQAFAQYEAGNALRKRNVRYDPEEVTAAVARSKKFFTRTFFAERAGSGCPTPDPIFIVGLTRAGSTLLEQILASHSAVEGTMELPDMVSLARRFGRKQPRAAATPYPESLGEVTAKELRALGEEYVSRTQIQRKTGRARFIDKMPNNWLNAGFIHLILPTAKIVDARRHPLACCFSNFKQLFARGQGYSYALADCGRYYRDYVEMMAHFDAVLPGRVHRVIYEEMVADPEGEIRRLLAYCGLPFEDRCLRFYENERAVRTASSEQVRQPISTAGLEHWRHFEPWLGDLKAALGPVLNSYPAAPA